MKKEFSISNDKVLMNYSARYCTNFESFLESDGFRRVLNVFKRIQQEIGTNAYAEIIFKI